MEARAFGRRRRFNAPLTFLTCKLELYFMKQNITLAVEKSLLKRARALAAQRGASVSAMLAQELLKIVESESVYQQAKLRALARLHSPFHLGGEKMGARESLHDRQNLR
jgi:hypothetical protein